MEATFVLCCWTALQDQQEITTIEGTIRMCATDLMRLHGQHRTESQLAQVRPAAGSGVRGSSKLKSCLPSSKPCSSICNFVAWHKHRLGIGTGMNSKKRARVFHVHMYIPHPVNLSSRHVAPCGLSREVLTNVRHEWERHLCCFAEHHCKTNRK